MSDLTFSTSDFRSSTQASKRNANRKHKWHLGSTQVVGGATAVAHQRPHRPSETFYNLKRRETKGAVASLAHGTKIARKHDMLEGATSTARSSSSDDNSSGSSSDGDEAKPSTPADAGVMYSFDAPRGPSRGSEILNVALAKAVVKFEEKETAKLVKDEYDFVEFEAEDERVGKKGKGKGKAVAAGAVLDHADEEEYEFV